MEALEVASIAYAREVLDRFGVGDRLQHIRQFIWRGGTMRLEISESATRVDYCLLARWPDAVLEDNDSAALIAVNGTAVDGRWVRGESGYTLSAGIDLAVPSAIAIRSDRHASFVPFYARPMAEVERALDADLAAYVQHFLSACHTVPRATAVAAARLAHLGLT